MIHIHEGSPSEDLEKLSALVSDRLKKEEIDLLQNIIAQTRQAEKSQKECEDLKRSHKMCKFQREISSIINLSKDISDLAEKLAALGPNLDAIDSGNVYICNENTDVFERISWVADESSQGLNTSFSYKFLNEILQIKDQVAFFDHKELDELTERGFSIGNNIFSMACIPVLYGKNLIAAIMYTSNSNKNISISTQERLKIIGSNVGSVFSRMATEKSLRLSEENYRLLIENQSDLVIKVDVRGKIMFANKVCCDFFEVSPENIVNTQFLRYLKENKKRDLIGNMQKLMVPPYYFTFDQELGSGDQMKFISWRCNAVLSQNTGEVSAFVGIGRDMTESKKSETMLRQSEERFRLILRAVSDFIWDWDLVNDVLTYDNKLLSFLGYSSGEVELNIFDLIRNAVYIEDRARVESRIKDMIDGLTETFDCSYRMVRKDGEFIWVLMRAVVIKDVKGEPVRMVGCLEDISERKNFDNIKENYEFLQKILDALPLPVFYKDIHGRYLGFNQASKTFFSSITPVSPIGKSTYEVWNSVDPDLCSMVINEDLHLLKSGYRHISYALNLGKHKGEDCDVVIHKSIVDDAEGNSEYIIGVIIDVTDLKRTENAFKLASQRLNTILNVMHEIIIWFDNDMKAVWGNRAAYTILGSRHGGEIKGVSCNELWYESTDKDCKNCPMMQALQASEASSGERRVIHFEDGRVYEIWFYPVQSSGNERGWVQLALDVTTQEQARKEAEIRQEQLIQADKMTSLGILVSGVAHEINNPNNFIVINVSILKRAWENIISLLDEYADIKGEFHVAGVEYSKFSTMVGDLLDGVEEGAERIRVIVNDLKDYVRQTPTDLNGKFNVNDALSRAFTLCRNLLKKSTNNYKLIYGDNLPPVRGDVYRIEQVIINVVQNACHALKNRTDAIIVKTYPGSDESGEIIIEVDDEGVGITKDELKHIADPFFTTKRDIGGTGLGLSISTSIVEEHGGKLNIDSTPGKGTTVKICLPRYEEPAVITKSE